MLARADAAGIFTSLIKLVEQGPNHQLVYRWDLARWPLILSDGGAVNLVEVGEESYGTYFCDKTRCTNSNAHVWQSPRVPSKPW